MPKLTAGGPPSVNDEVIIRTDITPDDILKMSDDELTTLLTRLRSLRETPIKRNSSSAKVKAPTTQNPDDFDMD